MKRIVHALVVLLVLASVASGQGITPPGTAPGAKAPPRTDPSVPPGRFLALDVFGGLFRTHEGEESAAPAYPPNGKTSPLGWEAGATFRYRLHWLGISTRVGNETFEGLPVDYATVGVSVQTSFWSERSLRNTARLFAHALAGWSRADRAKVPDETFSIFGAGIDFWLFRLEVDGVDAPFEGLKKDGYVRIVLGGVLPLCFQACRRGDMFNVSGRPVVPERNEPGKQTP